MIDDTQLPPTRFNKDTLTRWAEQVLLRVGLREDDAWELADILVTTDARGISTHGIALLPRIASAIRRQELNPMPVTRIVTQSLATLHVDGDNGPGQIVARQCMRHAIEIAKEAGTGVVAVSNTNHFGAASSYTEQAAAAGFWGLALSNSRALVAAPGGTMPFLGTNPISLAAVGQGGHPFVIDFSTAASSRGKIRAAERDGKPIPEGVAADHYGRPTTDAGAALSGFLLPLGGTRGLALGLIVELLAGLGAARLSTEIPEPETRWGGLELGQLFIALDPVAFGDPGEVAHRVSRLQDSTRQATGRAPGDRRRDASERSEQTGIMLSPTLLQELRILGSMVGETLPNEH